MAFFIPFVLWGTVRFGPAGAALSLLATALVVIWSATHGQGGFASPPTPDSVLVLQISLAVSAIPVLALAGLLEERWRDRLALADRLRFEELLARLSGAFVHLASNRMDEAFLVWLERVGQFLGVDRVMLLRLSGDGRLFAVSHGWAALGLAPMPTANMSALLPWTARQLLRERPVVFRSLRELPEEAARDRDALAEVGIAAKLALPLVAGGRVLGGLSLVTVGRERAWPDELIARLQLVAEVFANALGRKESEDALRASELMKSAILASLNSSVAVLDGRGQVIEINRVWARFTPRLQPLRGPGGRRGPELPRRLSRGGEPGRAARRRRGRRHRVGAGRRPVSDSSWSTRWGRWRRSDGSRCRWCRSIAPMAARWYRTPTSPSASAPSWRRSAPARSSPTSRASPPWASSPRPSPTS